MLGLQQIANGEFSKMNPRLNEGEIEAALVRLKGAYGELVESVYTIESYPHIEDMPALWKGLVGKNQEQYVSHLWGFSKDLLPSFYDYLTKNLIEIFIGEGPLGIVMIYFIDVWENINPGEFRSGFAIGGKPILEDEVTQLEGMTGKLPSSLKELWKSHSFFTLRNWAVITSPQSEVAEFYGSPKIIGTKTSSGEDRAQYECLAFAQVSSEFPFCYLRTKGEANWSESIANVGANDELLSRYHHEFNLDSLLLRDY